MARLPLRNQKLSGLDKRETGKSPQNDHERNKNRADYIAPVPILTLDFQHISSHQRPCRFPAKLHYGSALEYFQWAYSVPTGVVYDPCDLSRDLLCN